MSSTPGNWHRCVFHLDIDAFYVACELRRRPSLRGRPLAVTQYNSGGFVAVSHEARLCGVRKGDGIGAKGQKELEFFKNRPSALMGSVRKRCPNLVVLPMDTSYYRKVTAEVLESIKQAPCWKAASQPIVEQASMDDFYVDATTEVRHREQLWCLQSSRPNLKLDGRSNAIGQQHLRPFDPENFASSSDESDDGNEEFMGAYSNARGGTHTGESGVSGDPRLTAAPCVARIVCPTHFDVLESYQSPAREGSPQSRAHTPGPGKEGPRGFRALAAAAVCHELRSHIKRVTGGITLSGGIADSKLLARLISKRNLAPDTQTLLLPQHLNELLRSVPLNKVPGLRGKLGKQIEERLKLKVLADLGQGRISPHDFMSAIGVTYAKAKQFCDWGRGIDDTPVLVRGPPKSLLVERSYPEGQLDPPGKLDGAIFMLCSNLLQRIGDDYSKHGRLPGSLVVLRRIGYNGQSMNSKRAEFPQRATSALREIFGGNSTSRTAPESRQISEETVRILMIAAKRLIVALSEPKGITRLALTATGFYLASAKESIRASFAKAAGPPVSYKSGRTARSLTAHSPIRMQANEKEKHRVDVYAKSVSLSTVKNSYDNSISSIASSSASTSTSTGTGTGTGTNHESCGTTRNGIESIRRIHKNNSLLMKSLDDPYIPEASNNNVSAAAVSHQANQNRIEDTYAATMLTDEQIRMQNDLSGVLPKSQEDRQAAVKAFSDLNRRLIIVIDQDAFYAQVVMVARPELRERPLAVFQKYLCVTCNYPARHRGVKKLMSIKEAQKICPELELVSGERLDIFRQASKEILDCITDQMHKERDQCQSASLRPVKPVTIERVGFDEVFLDCTDMCHSYVEAGVIKDDTEVCQTFYVGKPSEESRQLDLYRIAAGIACRTRARLLNELGYECCAGISCSKMASKIAVNAHKPNAQTAIYPSAIMRVILNLPLKCLVGVGWRLSQILREASIVTCADALMTSFADLNRILSAGLKNGAESRARYVFLAARGIDETRLQDKGKEKVISVEDSMRQCKSTSDVESFLRLLSLDLLIRLDEDAECNQRSASRYTLRYRNSHINLNEQKKKRSRFTKWSTLSAQMPIEATDISSSSLDCRAKILADSLISLFRKKELGPFNMTGIGVAAHHFLPFGSGQHKQQSIKSMLTSSSRNHNESNLAHSRHPYRGENVVKRENATLPVAEREESDTQEGVFIPSSVRHSASAALSSCKSEPILDFICNECGEHLPSRKKLVEHKDFHLAKRLARHTSTPAERIAARPSKRHKRGSSTGLQKYFTMKSVPNT